MPWLPGSCLVAVARRRELAAGVWEDVSKLLLRRALGVEKRRGFVDQLKHPIVREEKRRQTANGLEVLCCAKADRATKQY